MSVSEQIAKALAAARTVAHVGVVTHADGGGWLLSVGGAIHEAWWPTGYYPTDGETVVAVLIGQTWHVVAPLVKDPSPVPAPMGKVKTVPSGATRITVTVDGTDMDLAFLSSYTPVVGHDVALMWNPGDVDPLVLGRRGSAPRPKPKPEDPHVPTDPTQPTETSGRETFAATDAGPWSATAGGWSSTAGRNVIQGSWGNLSYDGFWFYGSKPRNALKGATVVKAEIYLPNRLRMGLYNNPATASVRRHTSAATSRPQSKPALAGASANVSIPKIGSTRGWAEIPVALAQAIIDSGGGISLTGTTYLGFPGPGSGTGRNPLSGALRISWEK